jgi:hypothetical protein
MGTTLTPRLLATYFNGEIVSKGFLVFLGVHTCISYWILAFDSEVSDPNVKNLYLMDTTIIK